jgi:hypothetical protein
MSTSIKFADILPGHILPGDTIKVSYAADGVLKERSGRVASFADRRLYTLEAGVLWDFGWVGSPVFYLIDRPKPKLPTEAGSLVLARIIEGTQDTLALRPDGWWVSLGTGRFFKASEVAAHPWKLAKVVDA